MIKVPLRLVLILLLLLPIYVAKSQTTIDWSDNYQLQLSDFQSKATQIGEGNIYSLHNSAQVGFSFHMSNAEFMFTKNFNSKVDCNFNRKIAVLVAPDSTIAMDLVDFARYQFDLSELQARKFRQKLFQEKSAFSNVSFLKVAYDNIQQELSEKHAMASKLTDLGRNKEKLKELHAEVKKEIELLADYCKSCKPNKKKK